MLGPRASLAVFFFSRDGSRLPKPCPQYSTKLKRIHTKCVFFMYVKVPMRDPADGLEPSRLNMRPGARPTARG